MSTKSMFHLANLNEWSKVSAKCFGGSAAAHITTTGTRAFAHKIYPDLV